MKPELNDSNFEFPSWVAEIGQRIAWILLTPIFKFFLHFEVRGKENLENVSTNVIFALNHISEMDALMPSCAFNIFSKHIPIYCVALKRKYYKEQNTTRSFFYRPWLFSFIGAYSVEKGIKDFDQSLSRHIEFLRKGKNVEIFPEGKVKRNDNPAEIRGGVVALVKATGLPVIPIYLSGHGNTSASDFFLRKRYSILTFGKPIYPEEIFAGYDDATPENFSKIAEERIMKKILEIPNSKK